MVQNPAARLLTPANLIISSLIMLSALVAGLYRREFNTLLFVFKALSRIAPEYLYEQRVLMVPRSRLQLKGDRAFSIAGSKLCNSLPVSLR